METSIPCVPWSVFGVGCPSLEIVGPKEPIVKRKQETKQDTYHTKRSTLRIEVLAMGTRTLRPGFSFDGVGHDVLCVRKPGERVT